MADHELADFHPSTGHLHTCMRTTHREECDSQCAEALYAIAQDAESAAAGQPLLTPLEHDVIRQAGQLWNALCGVVADGPTRDADLAELIHHVHAIQHTVMAQAAARRHPGQYRALGLTLALCDGSCGEREPHALHTEPTRSEP